MYSKLKLFISSTILAVEMKTSETNKTSDTVRAGKKVSLIRLTIKKSEMCA
jgi:hypothetical protein